MKIVVTGGAGFIGSALIRYIIGNTSHSVINVDKLTYAGDTRTLDDVAAGSSYYFVQADICDAKAMTDIFNRHQPDAVLHLAAESHVDRSIDGPAVFIQTNIVGTYTMLEAAYQYWKGLNGKAKSQFRFLHVSTDEVYGALGESGLFVEATPYDPSSPYSASKASSDHLASAWHRTYGFPTIISNCSNNYGPYQFPEKLIPTIIKNAVSGAPIPVYGTGNNVRDWLYVEDHARALLEVVQKGTPGETYNVGGHNEYQNIEIVHAVCTILDELEPRPDGKGHAEQICFVTDRPGHDFRYAIDASKIKKTLGWMPLETFETGIRKTVMWYLDNRHWWQDEDKESGRLGLDIDIQKK